MISNLNFNSKLKIMNLNKHLLLKNIRSNKSHLILSLRSTLTNARRKKICCWKSRLRLIVCIKILRIRNLTVAINSINCKPILSSFKMKNVRLRKIMQWFTNRFKKLNELWKSLNKIKTSS